MDFPSCSSKRGVSFPFCLWCWSTVSHTEWELCWHPSDRQCLPKPKGITCVCPLCSETSSGIWQQSVPLCYFRETSVLCDQVSQASFIKLNDASEWFVLHFLPGGGELRAETMRVLSYFETVEREGERRVGGKRSTERERQGEKAGEGEEKVGNKQRQEKGGQWRPSSASSPPSASPQRENTTSCQVVSHHLFDLCWSYFIFIKNNSEEVL